MPDHARLTTIIVDGVDVELLRQQRDLLLMMTTTDAPAEIHGLVNFLDLAEGFA